MMRDHPSKNQDIKREIHRNRGIHLSEKLICIQFNILIKIIRQGEFIVHKFISPQFINHCYLYCILQGSDDLARRCARIFSF